MVSRWKRLGLLCGILAGLSAATGCTDLEVLTAGNGTLVANIRLNNASTNRFESSLVAISQLRLRPLDPAADAALGANDITLLDPSLPLFVDFHVDEIDPVFLIDQPLSAGRYQISSLTMTSFIFFDSDLPAPGAPCEETTTFYSDSLDVVFTDADLVGAIATVEANTNNELLIVFDVEAFLASYQAAHLCACGEPSCVDRFNPAQFVADNPTYMSFE